MHTHDFFPKLWNQNGNVLFPGTSRFPSFAEQWSDYVQAGRSVVWLYVGFQTFKHFLPRDFVRVSLKIEQNCRSFGDIFSGAIINNLFMTFTSRLKVDAKCVYQQWNWITVANYFRTPQVIERMGIRVLSLTHGSEPMRSDVICILWKSYLEIVL